MKKLFIIVIILLSLNSIAVFATESNYVDIGLSFNNPIYNNGQIYLKQPYLLEGDNEFNLYSDKVSYILENSFRVQIGDDYTNSIDFSKEFKNALSIDSSIDSGFGNGYRIYSKSFSSLSKANNYKDTYESKYGLNLKVVEINNKVFLDDGMIKVVIENDSIILKTDETTFNYKGRNYRGNIKFSVFNSNVSIINNIEIDDYLYGVLPREMSTSWHIEALKAQAIVARSYLIKNLGMYDKYGFDICNTSSCQVYDGYDYEGSVSNRAVDETSGKVVTYNNSIINAYYHSSSGGFTASSENVWVTALPYLKGVYDKYSIGAPNTNWTLSYTEKQLIDILKDNGYNVNSIKDMYIDEISEDGRVQKLVIVTDYEKIILIKENARKVFGYYDLKSIFYTISTGNKYSIQSATNIEAKSVTGLNVISNSGQTVLNPNQNHTILGANYSLEISSDDELFAFNGRGWGHGIGLSQWGAKAMAEQGFKCDEIIKFYYFGVEIN